MITGRLEIIDFKKGRVDLFRFERRAKAIVNLGSYNEVGPMGFGFDNRYRPVACLTDRTSLFGTEDDHLRSLRLVHSARRILPSRWTFCDLAAEILIAARSEEHT